MPLKLVRHPKRSPHWYLRGTVRGVHIFETTKTDDRKAAEAIRIKREAGLLERSVFGPGSTITFAEAAASYLEQGGEARFLGYQLESGKWTGLIGHFMSTPLSAIGQAEADEAAGKLYPGTAPATRKRQAYAPLLAVLHHAAKRKWIRLPAIESPKVKETPVSWATPEYVAKLLPVCAPALRRFVVLIVYTGCRLSEALRLDWDRDIDLAGRHITFHRTKNGKMRTAPIHDALLVELAAVPEAERSGPLFHWSDKCHVHRPLRRACEAAGLPYLSPHKLGRHTYATWLRRYAKRDLKGLQTDGGWDSISSVARYAHVVPGETEIAVAALPTVTSAPASDTVKPLKPKRIYRRA
jgi:integrase